VGRWLNHTARRGRSLAIYTAVHLLAALAYVGAMVHALHMGRRAAVLHLLLAACPDVAARPEDLIAA
jgi:hypothetical protein